jgi:hypothetical protein
MSDELPPLDDEMRGLLRGLRADGPAPSAARARVASRLSASLGIPLGVAGGLDAMGSADAAPPDMAMAPPTDASAATDVVSSGTDIAGALVDPDVVVAAAPAVLALAKGAAVAAPAATAVATTATASAATVGATATGVAASGTAASVGVLAMLTKPVVIGAFVAGSMLGGGTVKVVDEAMAPPPRVVYMPAQVEAADDDGISDEEGIVEADVETHDADPRPDDARTGSQPKKPRVVKKPTTTTPVDDGARASSDAKARSLAKERSFLEVARTALSRGESQAALVSLEKHKAQFKDGRLSEERDALLVLALVGTGRTSDAERAAKLFERAYPRSLLLSTVQAALAK